MTAPRTAHLSADELDQFLVQGLGPEGRRHLEQCLPCLEMAQWDRELVAGLEALPRFAPSSEFADRVMTRVTIVDRRPIAVLRRLPARLHAARRTLAVAAGWTLVAGAAATASVLWSLDHRELLAHWGNQALSEGSRQFWLAVRSLAATLTEQPWYQDLSALARSPGRLTAVLAGLSVAFLSGALAFRSLVALPTRPVRDGNW